MTKLDEVLAGMEGDERILFLANALMDECERQGRNLRGAILDSIIIDYYPEFAEKYPDIPNLWVHAGYGTDPWRLRGFRTKAQS